MNEKLYVITETEKNRIESGAKDLGVGAICILMDMSIENGCGASDYCYGGCAAHDKEAFWKAKELLGWISADDVERKPENREVYLVVVNNRVDMAVFKNGAFWNVVEDRSCYPRSLKVTHWMPKPDIPTHK